MWVFLTLFVLLGFTYTVFNFSLADNRKIILTGLLLTGGYTFFIYPFCMEVTNQMLTNILEHHNLISTIAVIQIIESIAAIYFSIHFIKSHYSNIPAKISGWISVIPSVVFLIGIFLLQSHLFLYHIGQLSFWTGSLLISVSIAAITFFSLFLLKKIFPVWEVRMELKILVSLGQILFAMFLPLLIKGLQVPFTNLTIDTFALGFAMMIIGIIATLGFIRYLFVNKYFKR